MATQQTLPITCGNCGRAVAALVIAESGFNGIEVPYGADAIQWLQCPACYDGCVLTMSGVVWPVAPAGGSVANLPEDVAQAWREARTAHAVAAYTSSEIMCRKILMHVAVDVAQSQPGATFLQYIDALDKAGYFGPKLRPAIDKVRQRGNAANHDLPASTETESLVTLRITEHLLRGVYEIPAL